MKTSRFVLKSWMIHAVWHNYIEVVMLSLWYDMIVLGIVIQKGIWDFLDHFYLTNYNTVSFIWIGLFSSSHFLFAGINKKLWELSLLSFIRVLHVMLEYCCIKGVKMSSVFSAQKSQVVDDIQLLDIHSRGETTKGQKMQLNLI